MDQIWKISLLRRQPKSNSKINTKQHWYFKFQQSFYFLGKEMNIWQSGTMVCCSFKKKLEIIVNRVLFLQKKSLARGGLLFWKVWKRISGKLNSIFVWFFLVLFSIMPLPKKDKQNLKRSWFSFFFWQFRKSLLFFCFSVGVVGYQNS